MHTNDNDPVITQDICDSMKRQQILDGAREIFLRDGFDGASMNDITRAAGVSKGTVYAYFRSKEMLFETLIREDKRRSVETIVAMDWSSTDLPDVLFRLGMELVKLFTNPAATAQMRIVIGAAAKFPQIGAAFFEAGPKAGQARLAQYFQELQANGALAITDYALAASQFVGLCRGDYMLRGLLDIKPAPSPEELDYHVRAAVDIFLKQYRASD